jgi:membrane protein involved in colicin uptake
MKAEAEAKAKHEAEAKKRAEEEAQLKAKADAEAKAKADAELKKVRSLATTRGRCVLGRWSEWSWRADASMLLY